MLEIYEVCVIIISIILAINSIKKTVKVDKTIYLVHLLFFFVFVLPLIMDYVFGFPSYSSLFYGFNISYNDAPTRYVYATYILLSQIIMLIVGNNRFRFSNKKYRSMHDLPRVNNIKNLHSSSNSMSDFLMFGASIITVVLVVVFPMSKEILWNFGWRDLGVSIVGQKYYSTVEKLSYISIVSAIIFLFKKQRKIITKVFFITIITMSICVQAKRSIIFFAGVLIISYLLFNTKMSNRKWIYLLGTFIIITFLLYSIYVKITYRDYIGFESIYTTLRIDFFRDDTVKMVIHSLLYPNTWQVLEYPGQSIITQIGSLFPLQFLHVPSMGYNSYLTSALIGVPVEKSINWMTTSIFDEMIANFGFLGFWIAPTILGIFAKIADRQNNRLIPITIAVIMLLMMYSPSYIMWFIQFWLLIVIVERVFRAKRRVGSSSSN
ncbi:O-antigen polymerase [Fredinandcohnia sp. 179-A 10B2 NHS]|uniref:O-antigen polymerase n=1 Tax=Fredinandcohnia sp. 179-A 10B2 NHS TaxID=3235176 RepID=UPI0039A3044C